MRFLKITWRPISLVAARYAAQPDAVNWSYERQRKWLFSDYWGSTDAYETFLGRYGYEPTDLIADCPRLNTAWWRENGGGPQPDADGVLAAQIRRLDPEILYIEGIERYAPARIAWMKDQCPGLRLTILTSGTDINYDALLPMGDLFIARIPKIVPQLRARGYDAELLRHAFDTRVLERMGPPPPKDIALSFTGALVFGANAHHKRQLVLDAVARELPLTLFSDSMNSLPKAVSLYGRDAAAAALSRLMPNRRVGGRLGAVIESIRRRRSLPTLQYDALLRRHAKPAVFGMDMFRTLAASRVTLNVQPEIGLGSATNMRIYEATGVATCLVTDMANDLHELFVPDEEIVAFASIDELLSKLRALDDHPADAIEIGRRAQARVIRDHTYDARLGAFDRMIRQRLENR
jgi:hypothetical protein